MLCKIYIQCGKWCIISILGDGLLVRSIWHDDTLNFIFMHYMLDELVEDFFNNDKKGKDLKGILALCSF